MTTNTVLCLFAFVLFVGTKVISAKEQVAAEIEAAFPKPHHDHGQCEAMCMKYCDPHHPKRACEKACVPCCDVYKCVPGVYNSCSIWDEVVHQGRRIKCPKF